MVSFKSILLVCVAAAVIFNGESYETKRLLQLQTMDVAEAEEADDSECVSLEMAEEQQSTNNNNGDYTQMTQRPGTNNWGNEESTTNTLGNSSNNNGGNEESTYQSNGNGEYSSINNWGNGEQTNQNDGNGESSQNTDTSQTTQGDNGGEVGPQKLARGAQSETNLNFNSFQNSSYDGTVAPQ